MSFTFHRKSPLNLTPVPATPISKRPSRLRTYPFIKGLGGLGLLCLILGLAFMTVRQESVYASQEVAGRRPITAEQGIKGYVVGSGDVSAYACPDVNTAKCPIKLTLKPGTQVVILDNVIGANVPGLNDNAWRKIAYQGQTLFVPMRYISVTPPDNASAQAVQDVSFV